MCFFSFDSYNLLYIIRFVNIILRYFLIILEFYFFCQIHSMAFIEVYNKDCKFISFAYVKIWSILWLLTIIRSARWARSEIVAVAKFRVLPGPWLVAEQKKVATDSNLLPPH